MADIIIRNKTIKELGELKLVGFRVLCPGNQYLVEIPKASLMLTERISEIKQAVNPNIQIGAFVVENQTPDEDGYWIGVEVKEYENIPNDMVILTIPPQRYAVLKHTGPNSKIVDAYNDLHNWIEDNDYVRLKNKWHLERFYEWKDTEKVEVDLLDTIE
ncbi:GyrI-like domain-containing protein [Solibacillus silvestris]|uniref:GyrI-like domain-containing protein n=1 Tax=Solibacillus silvestris TaxID=76853 RepID=UPI003F816F00